MDDFEGCNAGDADNEATPPPEPESAPVERVDMPDLAEADVAMYRPDILPEPEDASDIAPEAAQAALPEPGAPEKAKTRRRPDSDQARIEVLSRAIERYPDAAVNYVLRGEAWLALGLAAQAREDFRTALALAGEAAQQARWGYVEQALADRARDGLRELGE